MTAPTAQTIKDRMDAMKAYIDRLYATIQWHGKTCAVLRSYPGMPLWAKINGEAGVWIGSTESGYKGVYLYSGGSWTQKDNGMSTAAKESVRDIAVSPHNPQTILATTTADGVWRTTDGGANWSQVLSEPGQQGYRCIAWDTQNSGKVIITGPDLGSVSYCPYIQDNIYHASPRAARSTDSGANWTTFTLPTGDGGVLNPFHYSAPPSVVAYHDGHAIISNDGTATPPARYYWTSTNGGVDWTLQEYPYARAEERWAPFLGETAKFFSTAGQVIGSGEGAKNQGIIYTTGYAPQSWFTGGPPDAGTNTNGYQLVRDTKRNRWWYVKDAIYWSDNNGISWSNASIGTYFLPRALAYDHANDVLYVMGVAQGGYSSSYNGVYASNDGGSIWTKISSNPYSGTAIAAVNARWGSLSKINPYKALGQWFGSHPNRQAHSVVSGQAGVPSWVAAAASYPTYDQFTLGLDDGLAGQFLVPPAVAKRTYSTNEITYRLEQTATDYETNDIVDIYLGPTKIISDLKTACPNKDSWSAELTKSSGNFLANSHYPARHSFALGEHFYRCNNDGTKYGYFVNSRDESGFDYDIYDALRPDILDYKNWPLYWQFDRGKCYRDTLLPLKGDQTSELPNGLADDGAYIYPYESKIRGTAYGVFPASIAFVDISTRLGNYTRILWALWLLAKRQGSLSEHPLAPVPDPVIGWTSEGPGTWPHLTDPEKVLAYYAGQFMSNMGRGLEVASDVTASSSILSALGTATFCAATAILAYGQGYNWYQALADDAADALCRIVWGVSPNGDGKGYVNGTELTRPDHKGGVLPLYQWDATNQRFECVSPEVKDHEIDLGGFWKIKIHNYLGDRVWMDDVLRTQKPDDGCIIPTNMESTVIAWLCLRIYLAYKYGEAYPANTWAYGLEFSSGNVAGRVTDGNDPVASATVILANGTQTANPQDLTGYIAVTTTDDDGSYTFRYGGTGNKTLYVVKSGYKHLYKTYNFQQPDQNIMFPEAVLVTV